MIDDLTIRYPQLRLKIGIVSALLLGLMLLLGAQNVQAQIPGISLNSPILPAGVAKTPSAAVKFNNRTLFLIYADDAAKAKDRADLVGLRLDQVMSQLQPGDALPSVTVRAVSDEMVVLLDDHPLLTATTTDENVKGEPGSQIANGWAQDIQEALVQYQRERGPDFLREAALEALWIVLISILITFLVSRIAKRLLDRPGWAFLSLVWLITISRICDLFPQTRPLHNFLRSGIIQPLGICLIVALASAFLARLLGTILRRVFPPIPDSLSPNEHTERTYRRRATLGAVARVTGVAVIWCVAAVVALSWNGVNLTALLTSAGLMGVAIGLAAQDTIKDLMAGINILIDDRFGVGDHVLIGDFSGIVENLNLRVTQVRDGSGRVITFPNRTVEVVANSTLRWAQVDFQIGVDYSTDLRQAMAVMLDTARKLSEDWPERILAAPEMLGVESFNAADISLRMQMRTIPGDQWKVARELRLRIKEAFDANGIVISLPRLEVNLVEKSANNEVVDQTPPI